MVSSSVAGWVAVGLLALASVAGVLVARRFAPDPDNMPSTQGMALRMAPFAGSMAIFGIYCAVTGTWVLAVLCGVGVALFARSLWTYSRRHPA